jgi:FKBP-type peptidyl-prolyl cis-trans isomerase FklB
VFFNQSQAQVLKNKSDSLSYALGILLADGVIRQNIKDLNIDLVQLGLGEKLSGNETILTAQNANVLMKKHAEAKAEADKLEADKLLLANKQNGIDFLLSNAERMEVTTLPSGLQYEILIEGEGESPTKFDNVTCHYVGTLIDGTVFDSSVDRGEPLSFGLGKVIKAWQEALPLMKKGSKWKIYSPYKLAYGERSAGKHIKPYSALIFEVELIEFSSSQ